MTMAVRVLPCILALCTLLAGCTTARLANSWKDPQFAGPQFKNVLVVGVTRSDANRRIFEDRFSETLRASGVGAVPSYTLIPDSGAIPNERMREAVARVGADAVLVARVQRVEQRVEVSPGFGAPFYGRGFYGWYGEAWAGVPPDIYQYDVITLETTLWDMRREQITWAGTSQAIDPKNVSTLSADLAKVLIAKMRGDGVL